MANGPRWRIGVFNRALINSLKLCCSSVERRKRAKDSITMMRDSSCGLASARTSVRFGIIRSFLKVGIPSSGPLADAHAIMVEVEWFKRPEAPHDWNLEIGCPVVSKEFDGVSVVHIRQLVPTKPILAPHLGSPDAFWQVLHTDSDFLTRSY